LTRQNTSFALVPKCLFCFQQARAQAQRTADQKYTTCVPRLPPLTWQQLWRDPQPDHGARECALTVVAAATCHPSSPTTTSAEVSGLQWLNTLLSASWPSALEVVASALARENLQEALDKVRVR
jgi:hypothetical protein